MTACRHCNPPPKWSLMALAAAVFLLFYLGAHTP